ncbi:MAG: zinc ABC transporter substrate-binding protein, partial [Clostridia bacterium]|nr:zinc ABC transporter substrate-binding protein [Clostridia bacterium]
MERLKKTALMPVILILALLIFTSCGSETVKSDKKIKIVATIFPEYDWVSNILGDDQADTDVTLLIDNGVDLHSYQPTVDDVVKISTCDIFIYVGGESDKWVCDALKEARNRDMIVIDLMEILGDAAKEEEIKEGMQGEDHDDHEHEEVEYDEHVWLSVRNAALFCEKIEEAIETKDPANAAEYRENLAKYEEKLRKLDSEYKTVFENATVKTLLFGDRFPFRYFTDDYGLDYYAAFAGCSAETEASFETVVFLAGKVDELG